MTPAFDPSFLGILAFGMVAGICPCNIALCLGLMGYLTGGEARLSSTHILVLVLAFSLGTILILLPLGIIAAIVGKYVLFINGAIAWALGGALMIAMGLQLLHVYKPPMKSIFNVFKRPETYTVIGTFFAGISFGAITIGRGAPMLLTILTYIALYQTPVNGLLTMAAFALGFSIPLIIISSVGGAIGKKVKDIAKVSGAMADRVFGVLVILLGIYFLYLAATACPV